jgi:lipooligosaccharide transport system ATP-binding protein
MSSIIEAKNLVKKYGTHNAVNGISFTIEAGICFGLLGPNGAGKSTTFKMCYGAAKVTSGELFIKNISVKENSGKIKSLIGVVPQENGLDPDFSALDNLLLYANYYGLPKALAKDRAKELLINMQLEEYAERSVEQMSGGMKRRLAIARALLTHPKIIFLDEPTTGLDPQARAWIWDEVRELKERGSTVVLSTHYMEEAEALCDNLVVMSKGIIVAEGSPQKLIEKYVGKEVIEFEVLPKEMDYFVSKIKDQFQYQVMRNRLKLFVTDKQNPKDIINLISSENITMRKASLNDVFLKVSGYELND